MDPDTPFFVDLHPDPGLKNIADPDPDVKHWFRCSPRCIGHLAFKTFYTARDDSLSVGSYESAETGLIQMEVYS